MPRLAPFAVLLCVSTLAGCAENTATPFETSRAANPALTLQSLSLSESALQDQAEALTQMNKGIVQASTRKSALAGAAISCGLAFASTGAASRCATSAALGAAGGAIMGKSAAQTKVAQQIEVVSPSNVVRSIKRSNDQLASVKATLPVLLAQQDAELAEMKAGLADNSITQMAYDKKVAQIRAKRADLARALLASEKQAATATQNLQNAAAQGQNGLEWHILSTKKLQTETYSARSAISLL